MKYPSLGPYPIKTECPECGAGIITRTEYSSSTTTHIMAFLFCIFCCLGFLPYITPYFRNVDHFCPSCNAFLGTHSRQI